jgi:ribosome biogenesis protein UTP30
LFHRSIKIAPVSFTPAQVLENLTTALPNVIKHIKGGWDNIQSLNIKTGTSVSLPIWSCELGSGEGGRWAGMVGASEESEEGDSSEEEVAVVPKEGKKRAAAAAPAAATASKKAKASPSDSAKPTKSAPAPSSASTKTKPAASLPSSKPASSPSAPISKKQAKKAIPQTPIVESDSEDEPEPAHLPKSTSKTVTDATKKRAAVAGIEQKKVKVLSAKGVPKKGSKAGIVGAKKIAR